MKLVFCAALVVGALSAIPAYAVAADDCHVGSYRLRDGTTVDVAPSEADTLRWRLFTGETGRLRKGADGAWNSTVGWTDRSDGKTVSFSDCRTGHIAFGLQTGHRIAFEVRDTTFVSNGATLVGRLVMPAGRAKAPVVVLVHGSEHDSALQGYSLQRMFPAQGIGVFVYDKRGTGASGGAYTQDFQVLAEDAVAALKEARRLGGARIDRFGYQGGSEGGWVAPLAAERTHVDFTIVSFGLAVTVLEEDQQSVALDMRFHNHEADTGKALELARAGEHVIERGDKDGYATFDALRRKYRDEAWYKDVHGDFLFMILPLDKSQIDAALKAFDFHTPFRYEPMPVLRRSRTPQLWILGGDDLEAPSAETGRRIRALIAEGRNYTLAVYPGAEHGMTEYELDPKRERVSTRYAAGYFQMMADFVRSGRVNHRYGNADITRPAKSAALRSGAGK